MDTRLPSRGWSRAILLALIMTLSSCSSVRSIARRMNNTNQVGDLAPGLHGEAWVAADDSVVEAEPEVDWLLLVFMSPT